MGSFFRCVLRVTSCGSCTAEFSLQYFNPERETRNASISTLQYSITPVLHDRKTHGLEATLDLYPLLVIFLKNVIFFIDKPYKQV